jgi:hypothetical protein
MVKDKKHGSKLLSHHIQQEKKNNFNTDFISQKIRKKELEFSLIFFILPANSDIMVPMQKLYILFVYLLLSLQY